ncbi:MAG: hypothetical protein LBN07_03545 [Christensenellaceae bacterium]|jgi:N-glycosylase/DNA lyase|nr:hypothetical protein [Christensenellaceae bacterium]
MNITKTKDKIIISDTADFDIKQILECGQVFRFKNLGDRWTVFSKNYKAEIFTYSDRVEIISSNTDYFYNYFDLDTDYDEIKRQLLGIDYDSQITGLGTEMAQNEPEMSGYEYMSAVIECGSGIRILRQDLFEVIISFIISANNNIKRIQGIIERMCSGLGTKMEGFYAFPTLEQLLKADISFFEKIGAGYRAKYLYEATRQLAGEYNDILVKTPARERILQIMGVGPKVANCIMLFAFHRLDTAPVDVHIKRAIESMGKIKADVIFNHKYAGVAQQYIFYSVQNLKLDLDRH